MPSEEYHLERYHEHRKWARFQDIITGLSILSGVGLLWAWITILRGRHHRAKAEEHIAEVDQDICPESVNAEDAIPCSKCTNPMSDDDVKCPHCGEKRMTKDRREDYLLLYIPMVALPLATLVWLVLFSAAPINHIAAPIAFIAIYATGYRWVTSKRQDEIEWLEQHSAGTT